MGFYDDLTIEKAYPEYGISPGTVFQTKSLYQGSNGYTINADGKLIENCYRYETTVQPGHAETDFPLRRRVHVGDRPIEYHGDILLCSSTACERFDELVVRFTHGRVEWIRLLDEYPEANRALLIAQGAR